MQVLLLGALSAVGVRTFELCVEEVSYVHFSVNSKRNLTGHRRVKADLMHKFPGGQSDNETSLDVEHATGKCGDLQYVRVATTADTGRVVTATPRPVPAGYELFPGVGYYKLYTTRQPWADAQETCQKEGAHLIVVNSEGEAEVIKNIYSRKIPELASTGTWTGFHDQFKPGHFVTVFGEKLSSTGYEKWNSNQPQSGKHCGYVYQKGMLHTWDCPNSLPFLCELPR